MMAAQASYAEVSMAEALRDIRVADVMANDCVTVDLWMKVENLVDDVLLRTGRRCVLVQRDDRIIGLVTPHEIRRADRARWADLTVAEVMRPLDTLKTVTPATPVAEALKTMARDDVNQLPVVADGRVEGVVTRSHILQLLQSRGELKAA